MKHHRLLLSILVLGISPYLIHSSCYQSKVIARHLLGFYEIYGHAEAFPSPGGWSGGSFYRGTAYVYILGFHPTLTINDQGSFAQVYCNADVMVGNYRFTKGVGFGNYSIPTQSYERHAVFRDIRNCCQMFIH